MTPSNIYLTKTLNRFNFFSPFLSSHPKQTRQFQRTVSVASTISQLISRKGCCSDHERFISKFNYLIKSDRNHIRINHELEELLKSFKAKELLTVRDENRDYFHERDINRERIRMDNDHFQLIIQCSVLVKFSRFNFPVKILPLSNSFQFE